MQYKFLKFSIILFWVSTPTSNSIICNNKSWTSKILKSPSGTVIYSLYVTGSEPKWSTFLLLFSLYNFNSAYFKISNYPTAGNYLRKTSEEIMKYLLSDIFKPSDKDGLDSLIKNLKTKYDEFKITIPESISKLEELTKRIFNPASHNDLINPLYKKEIDDAIQVVKELKDLKKIKIIDLSISQGSLLTFEY